MVSLNRYAAVIFILFLLAAGGCSDDSSDNSGNSEAHLANIFMSPEPINGYVFKTNYFGYSIIMPFTINEIPIHSIIVSPLAMHSNGTIQMRSLYGDTITWTTVSSGASNTVCFTNRPDTKYGNIVEIRSVAEDGRTSLTYTLDIIRASGN